VAGADELGDDGRQPRWRGTGACEVRDAHLHLRLASTDHRGPAGYATIEPRLGPGVGLRGALVVQAILDEVEDQDGLVDEVVRDGERALAGRARQDPGPALVTGRPGQAPRCAAT
jgi:hypothetical protein